MKYTIVAIVGPTGVGKSNLAVELAKRHNGEIISTDSMQIYQGLNIGTAKISPQETNDIPHYFLDIIKPDESFSVADFQKQGRSVIEQIISRNKLPFVVGGTGLYLQALIDTYNFQEQEVDQKRRSQLHQLATEQGNQYVHHILANFDPELATKLHPNDIRRVIRGIEYYEATGKKISQVSMQKSLQSSLYNPIMIGLTMERQLLYERIENRVDQMISDGLVAEVKELLAQGYDTNLVSLQGLGYKEVIGYLKGDYDLAEAVYLLKRNTRHFAKRQITWFKKDQRISWFEVTGDTQFSKLAEDISIHITEQLKRGVNHV